MVVYTQPGQLRQYAWNRAVRLLEKTEGHCELGGATCRSVGRDNC